MRKHRQDICEIFGFAAHDTTTECRRFWDRELCPFVGTKCSKFNHDKTITYGVCSVVSSGEEVIICPKRLYADGYLVLREVAFDAFGYLPLYLVDEVMGMNLVSEKPNEFVLAFGHDSGKEIQVGSTRNKLSMDWVLVKIVDGEAVECVGVEVQSIDITNNYRENWKGYSLLAKNKDVLIPKSEHGMNWANVHKRLIPQIIRKGKIYSASKLATKGLYFVVPDAVYQRFEEIVGTEGILDKPGRGVLTVFTYSLGDEVKDGNIRKVNQVRTLRILLRDFALNFISGGESLGGNFDEAVKRIVEKTLQKCK
jgi:hypothetical protein